MSMLSSAIPLLLFAVGLFYLFRLRWFYLLHPVRCVRLLFGHRPAGGISPFRALTVALAGTLGVGNIVGVAAALYFGGPGAVLWMLVSALVAMVLKYAEITLALRHRRISAGGEPVGGAPYYIRDGLTQGGMPRLGKILAAVFALLCLVNAVTMGSLLQVNAVAGAMETGFSIHPFLTGGAVAILAVIALKGGASRIASLTEKLVPLMTVGFLVVCAAVLILRRERIPRALWAIWEDAFSPATVGAGIGGFFVSKGVRLGVMRGLISNEAGCGTAPMAHATAQTDLPARQGLFGLVEVFVDTVLLCSVTALCILVSDSGPTAYGEDTVRTAQAAFSSVLGEWAGWFFAVAMLLFGVATVLCWIHYGKTCAAYLGQGSPTATRFYTGAYAVALVVSVVMGAVVAPTAAWKLADTAISLMTVLNLAILLLMHREVRAETDRLWEERNDPHCISCQGKRRSLAENGNRKE